MDVVEDDRREVLIVTSQAYGKRTPDRATTGTSSLRQGVKAFAKEKEIGTSSTRFWYGRGRAADDHVGESGHPHSGQPNPARRTFDQGRAPAAARRSDEVIAIANLGQQSKAVAEITGEARPRP